MSEVLAIAGEYNLFGKSEQVLEDWLRPELDPRVKALARHMAIELDLHGAPGVITEIFRPGDPKSVHHYGRGIDMRITCSMGTAEKLREKFNRCWPYRGKRLETIPKLDHGTAPHFHLQVAGL